VTSQGSDREFLIAVGAGSLAGGLLRYLLALPWLASAGEAFPWPTLLANVLGCLVIGFWFVLASRSAEWFAGARVQAAVMAGFCGGLTTFSVFSLETLMLVEAGRWPIALAYVMLSLPVWLAAVWAGWWIGRLTVTQVGEQS
jgi:fluoride exporter